ncbi:hypothetical protein E2P81_ATG08324 [Venturia nashicola]|uniref:WSC domain-containing protein n=1 Tax=Venturia nashicola TaxID=86259 RepID=A0A4Z1P3P7_9PEZI|nr:hypothetical protein E6O75_ATG08511 [Venturia nashicola]TLD21736.1 hypothetical protein E2P81_ATG08324 [Venturia nashicola]
MAIIPSRKHWTPLLRFLITCTRVQSSFALSAQYCSTQNTGGGASPNNSIYQSNGLCHDACLASYAFAVVQGRNCWCSNYAPAAQLSTSQCDTPCPGYPDELCGNDAQSLFGYIPLNVAPSGTLGLASSSTAASASRSSPPTSTLWTTTPTKTPEATQPQEESTTSSTVILPSTPQQSTPQQPTSQVGPTTSASPVIASTTAKAAIIPQTPTPVTQVQVVTQSGQIVTQTITTTPSMPASTDEASPKSGIAPGYIAAAAIAGLLGLAFIVAGIWFFMRRRKERAGEKGFQGGSLRDMQRNTSVHSKAGLLANRNGVPAINTRHSGQLLVDEAGTPVSPMSERRKSQPLIWDQRLNPNALMANENGSKTSLNTIDDHRDYGRTLQVTNPDPRRTSLS